MPGRAHRGPRDGEPVTDEPTRGAVTGRAGPGRALLPPRVRPARGACSRAGSGVRHLELVEDAVQSALVAALTAWVARACPTIPARGSTASRTTSLIGDLRREAGRLRILERPPHDLADGGDAPRRRTSRARFATTCCACSSSAATTPFPASRASCSR